jgi:hypothetical protein
MTSWPSLLLILAPRGGQTLSPSPTAYQRVPGSGTAAAAGGFACASPAGQTAANRGDRDGALSPCGGTEEKIPPLQSNYHRCSRERTRAMRNLMRSLEKDAQEQKGSPWLAVAVTGVAIALSVATRAVAVTAGIHGTCLVLHAIDPESFEDVRTPATTDVPRLMSDAMCAMAKAALVQIRLIAGE